jgi:hypothetical protein
MAIPIQRVMSRIANAQSATMETAKTPMQSFFVTAVTLQFIKSAMVSLSSPRDNGSVGNGMETSLAPQSLRHMLTFTLYF